MEEVIKKVTSRRQPHRHVPRHARTARRRRSSCGGSAIIIATSIRASPSTSSRRARACSSTRRTWSSATWAYDNSGPVAKVTEVIGDDRLRVGQDNGMQSLVLQRASSIAKETLKAGDEVRVDPNYRMALELMRASQERGPLSRRGARTYPGKKSVASRRRSRRSGMPSNCRSSTRTSSPSSTTRRRRGSCSTALPAAARRSSARPRRTT